MMTEFLGSVRQHACRDGDQRNTRNHTRYWPHRYTSLLEKYEAPTTNTNAI